VSAAPELDRTLRLGPTLLDLPVPGQLAGMLMTVVDLMRTTFLTVIGPFELSPPQWHALRSLASSGPVPMNALAATMSCDASNVTGLSDRLQARGLVERTSSPVDRRVKTLGLTEAGRRLVEDVTTQLIARTPVSVLDGVEQTQLRDLLLRLLDANGVEPAMPGQLPRSCP
jgi:DNA-binding MarR family transcriptional regulator